ncbi:MAG: hypothetical protein QG555_1548, partial [Thermodesulfobacteriota bacterium]|nr:hypothetical protein [Thermodesulfobacteriota bacterium]
MTVKILSSYSPVVKNRGIINYPFRNPAPRGLILSVALLSFLF